MGRKIPVFVKGGVPKNNNDTSHGISVFSYGENPTEFFCIVCLVPKFCTKVESFIWDAKQKIETVETVDI
jgi:hypothetical protein